MYSLLKLSSTIKITFSYRRSYIEWWSF